LRGAGDCGGSKWEEEGNACLNRARLLRARRLQAKGVNLSALVREAIDRRYEELLQSPPERDIDAIIAEIYEASPDPDGVLRRNYDIRNRRNARAAIQRKLRRHE
jgi:hypothetical protein